MNLFNNLVSEALKNQPALSALRIVVEKELLHHDIFRVLHQHKLINQLAFIGGTALRACYGGVRLSEDLDFTGGSDFTREQLENMGRLITESLEKKYELSVNVSPPVKEEGLVSTWKIKVETRPDERHIPSQRINIDICSVPSYEIIPQMLRNSYGVNMGTSGLIIPTQSREEIYTDKLLALALRKNRVKYRDLWDIVWLYQQNVRPNLDLVPLKLNDRKIRIEEFKDLYTARIEQLDSDKGCQKEFLKEMTRFLPTSALTQITNQEGFWAFLINLLRSYQNDTQARI